MPQYLKELPLDLFSGRQFAYSPGGEDKDVIWGYKRQTENRWQGNSAIRPYVDLIHSFIPRQTPFLLPWAAFDSAQIADFQKKDGGPDEGLKTGYDFSDQQRYLCNRVWNFGFELPVATDEVDSDKRESDQ